MVERDHIKTSMNKVIYELEKKGVKFSTLNAIEMFSKTGTIHTIYYANKVKSLVAWEIDPKCESELKKNLPNSKIIIGDSIRYLLTSENLPKYDFIVIDAPLNNFGVNSDKINNGPYCEHFDFIHKVGKFIDDQAIVVFNVNIRPFDYEKWPLWKKRREDFYGDTDTSNLNSEFLLDFYERLFAKEGLKTLYRIHLVRELYDGMEGLYYFVFGLQKNNF